MWCKILLSDWLPTKQTTLATIEPFVEWLSKQWKYVTYIEQSLQSLYSQSCGDHAVMYLREELVDILHVIS